MPCPRASAGGAGRRPEAARSAARRRRPGRCGGEKKRRCSWQFLEGAEDREEVAEPALTAGARNLPSARIRDLGVRHARRRDGIVEIDIGGADYARDEYLFVTAVEREILFALHQHRAVRIDRGHRDADRAAELV